MSRMRRFGNASRARLGFSFLEIMLVVMIIGIMVAVVGPRLVGRSESARRVSTKSQMENIKTALGIFEVKTGDFPATDQGLEALVRRPTEISEDMWVKCMDEVPKDAWGNEFIYRCPGEHETDYDLVSMGKDKKEGTKDDITNFASEEEGPS
ncbi:type II secretion system major pseudopilin GspG [Candidatus Sumerlaeota bacterium]|nr:type II secretion system major pseudopilin GspG [Candidatus Sumerlaeota bacterium]